MNRFIFDNINTDDYNIIVAEQVVDASPKRVYEEVEIAGKNGSLLIDAKRYDNCEHSYNVVFYDDYVKTMNNFRHALMSKNGYYRLSDTFNPDEFYIACVDSNFEVIQTDDRTKGFAEIIFTRKPERFLISGEENLQISSGGGLHNPTKYESRPLIHVVGYGAVSIGDYIFTITGSTSIDVYIDSDSMDCYSLNGSIITSRNSNVNIFEFPKLKEGMNLVSYPATITHFDITPRWWTL